MCAVRLQPSLEIAIWILHDQVFRQSTSEYQKLGRVDSSDMLPSWTACEFLKALWMATGGNRIVDCVEFGQVQEDTFYEWERTALGFYSRACSIEAHLKNPAESGQ